MIGAIVALLVGTVFTTVVVHFARQSQERLRRFTALAAQHGWVYYPGDPYHCARLPFRVLRQGRSEKVDHTLALRFADGVVAKAFQFHCTVGSGKSSHVERYSCVVIETGDRFPELAIEHEGLLGRMRDALGLHDIQFESDEFNRTFKISSDDVRFAHAMIDQRFMAWLLDHPTNGIAVAWNGPLVLVWCDQVLLEHLPGVVAYADEVRQVIPPVVRELYPPA